LSDLCQAIVFVAESRLRLSGYTSTVVTVSTSITQFVGIIERETRLRAHLDGSLGPRQFKLSHRRDPMANEKDYWIGGVATDNSADALAEKAMELAVRHEDPEADITLLKLSADIPMEVQEVIADMVGMKLSSAGPVAAYDTWLYVGTDQAVGEKPTFIDKLDFSSYPPDIAELYDEPTGVLELTFKGGGRYEFYEVPKRVAEELRDSLCNPEERGRLFNEKIKGVYDGGKLVPSVL